MAEGQLTAGKKHFWGGGVEFHCFRPFCLLFSSVWVRSYVLGTKTYARSVRSSDPVLTFCLDEFFDPGGLNYRTKKVNGQRSTGCQRSTGGKKMIIENLSRKHWLNVG
jgi:hypothetical protein